MFPVLKTGAVAQYPLERQRRFATRVHRFVDHSEQRWREFPSELKRWLVRLNLLDDAEIEAVRQFFLNQAGRSGTFAFTDPWNSTVHGSCSIDSDELEMVFQDEMRVAGTLVIRENRI